MKPIPAGYRALVLAAVVVIVLLIGGTFGYMIVEGWGAFEETEVRQGSSLCNRMLRDAGLRQDLGLIVVAIKLVDGRMMFNPAPETEILAGDTLITLGPRQQQEKLRTLAN